MATYAVLREGRSRDGLADLDEALGFEADEEEEDDSAVSAHSTEGRLLMLRLGGEMRTVA